MKLNDLKNGTYAGVRVLEPSNSLITKFVNEHKIPISTMKMEKRRHVTLIYSRTFFPLVASPEITHRAQVISYDLFDLNAKNPNGKKCLVMKLSAPSLYTRHNTIMSVYPQATYDFPFYQPHITLSYDIDAAFDVNALPLFQDEILLGEEYVETLKLNWE